MQRMRTRAVVAILTLIVFVIAVWVITAPGTGLEDSRYRYNDDTTIESPGPLP